MILRNSIVIYFYVLVCWLLQPVLSHAATVEVTYGMEEVTPWNGTNPELGAWSRVGGAWGGTAVGNPLPTSGYVDPAKTIYPLGYLQIEHPGEGVSCMATQVKVKSCISTDANGQCVPASALVTANLNAIEGDKVISSQSFYIDWYSSDGWVSLSIPASKTVSFTLTEISRTLERKTPVVCLNKLNNSDSCTYVSYPAGLIVADQKNGSAVSIANQKAGVESAQYYLRAVKTNTQTGACQAALKGASNVDFGYTCTNPITCSTGNLMSITGSSSTLIAANDKAKSALQFTAVPMAFDNDGNAPFTLNFQDVGQTTLDMRKTVNIVMKNFRGNLTACETQLSGNANLSSGISNIKLSAPGIGSDRRPNSGSVDVEINVGNVVAGEQTCSSSAVTSATSGALPWFGADPAARASFGLYKSPVIYFRESF